jgi:hypothetical protein
MTRREFTTLLAGTAAAWPLAAWGQQQPANLARIGFLRAAGPDDKDPAAFRSGLRARACSLWPRTYPWTQNYARPDFDFRRPSSTAIIGVPFTRPRRASFA